MEKKTLNVSSNGMEFYCEIRGEGPAIILVPDGRNDCEPYDNLSKPLSDEFTVVTFDPRGGSRSMDPSPQPVTPRMMADDIAGIARSLNLGKVGVFGVSSGGQAALAFGKYHAEMARNIIVHEAALQDESPLPGTGFQYFENLMSFGPYLGGGLSPMDCLVGNADATINLSEGCRQRMNDNAGFWLQYYLNSVDRAVYLEEDFAAMPPVDFSVGTWTPAFLVYANLETAKRGARSVTWINCAHHPEKTCPEEYAEYLRARFREFL